MEARSRHVEYEFPTTSDQTRDLGKHGVDVRDMLQHRVGQRPVETGIGLGHLVAARDVDAGIDAQRPRLFDFSRIRVDADELAPSNLLQDDPGEQPVATSEVKASAIGQAVRNQLIHLDRAPQCRGRLERVLVKKTNEQLPVQVGTSASALNTSPRRGQLSRYT